VAPGDAALWAACQAAHRGYQLGNELLLLIPRIGLQSGFCTIGLNADLEPVFPDLYQDAQKRQEYVRSLSPPPAQSASEIVAPMGGAFYAREAVDLPLLVNEGDHFDKGQPLFIIEVMKMFNKVLAPFSGTVTRSLMTERDGQVVAKGDKIFEIEPDEVIIEESEEQIRERQQRITRAVIGL
jgi:biotin carboxyl carrier protein